MRTCDTSTGSFLTAVQAVHNKNLDAAEGSFNFSLWPSSTPSPLLVIVAVTQDLPAARKSCWMPVKVIGTAILPSAL